MLQVLKRNEEKLRYSAVVLFERKNHQVFPDLLKNLSEALSSRNSRYEIIIVSNGPFIDPDGQASICRDDALGTVRIFELSKKTSETICFKAGFEECRGDIIISCGSYQQITRESLINLLDSMEEDVDIVCSWRNKRLDSAFFRVQSNLFNFLVRTITKSEFHDLSSSIRLFRRRVIQETEIYGNMYRFLPILAARKGFRAKEIKCSHFHQFCGPSESCGLMGYIERVTDIFTLYFISRFASKPLRFFGFLGMVFLVVGIFMNAYVFVEKFFLGFPIGDRPFLLLGMFLMVLGIQAASTGLLGEIITFVYGRHKSKYTIEKRI